MASVTILSDNGASSGSAGLKQTAGNDGVLILQTTTSGGTATNAVTIDTNQNVGVGISSIPNYNSNLRTVSFNNTSGVVHDYCVNGTRTGSFVCQSSGFDLTTQTAIPLIFSTNATERMRLDSSGNLGLGVTPSAWGGGKKVLQASNASFAGQSDRFEIWANAYYDGSAVKYISNGYATLYQSVNGAHSWQTAASGTAGGTVTLTQAMTLDASGNLGLGTTSPSAYGVGYSTFEVAGSVTGVINVKSGSTLYGQISNSTNQFKLDAVGASSSLLFLTNTTERGRITSAGYFYLGDGWANTSHRINLLTAQGNPILDVSGYNTVNADTAVFYACSGGAGGGASAAIKVGYITSNSRSIAAGGTINASGTDYAEYMKKAAVFTIAKGAVVGVDANGELTNVYADAVSFVVKSTNPSYVGGDTWGNEAAIGPEPERPKTDWTEEQLAQYEIDKAAFEAALEAARQTVDRIAFCGQVPVNVTGATPGQYIIPVNDNGAIKGQAVSNPTFEQYQQAVGKVIAIEQDGRARIIVKVA